MIKLLIVTRHTPLPWEDGAGAYLHDLARFLAGRGFQVDILWVKPHERLRWQKVWRLPALFSPALRLHLPDGQRLGRAFFFPAVVWHPLKARLFGLARAALRLAGVNPPRRNPPAAGGATPSRPWASPPTASELALAERFVARHRPDVVLANYAWMCPLFDSPAFHSVRRVCLAHDVGWKRAELSAGPGAVPHFSRADEAAWLRRAEVLIAISQNDADELRLLAPDAKVLLAPKSAEPRAAFVESKSAGLIFVGSDNAFNTEGLEWFLGEVWPLIRAELPAASLAVCGNVHRRVKARPDGVVFHGAVDSLDAYYREAAVVVVPLPRATGMNIKLVDAAAYGRAVVATSNTLLGAPSLRGAVATADSPADFAAAVLRLLDDPSARAEAAARALRAVREQLAPAACYGPLAAVLQGP